MHVRHVIDHVINWYYGSTKLNSRPLICYQPSCRFVEGLQGGIGRHRHQRPANQLHLLLKPLKWCHCNYRFPLPPVMSGQLLHTPSKHAFSLTGLIDTFWEFARETSFHVAASALAPLAQAAVTSYEATLVLLYVTLTILQSLAEHDRGPPTHCHLLSDIHLPASGG